MLRKGQSPLIILLVVGVLVIAGAAFYAGRLTGQPTPSVQNQAPGPTSPAKDVDWKPLLPQIKTILITGGKTQASPDDPHAQDSVGLGQTADITGDGVSEALIEIPWGGGAASWFVAVMEIQSGSPALVRIKDSDGSISDGLFLDAGSAAYGMITKLDAAHHAIVYTQYGQDLSGNYNPVYTGGYATCSLGAYAWNPATQIFEWNVQLGASLKDQYCVKATPQNTP